MRRLNLDFAEVPRDGAIGFEIAEWMSVKKHPARTVGATFDFLFCGKVKVGWPRMERCVRMRRVGARLKIIFDRLIFRARFLREQPARSAVQKVLRKLRFLLTS